MARVSIDDGFMKPLQQKLGDETAAKVTEQALTLLSWAVNEVASGKTIYSAAGDGASGVSRLAMPVLQKVKGPGL